MCEHEIPEILAKRTVKQLPSEDLENRILKLLASRQLCMLSTFRDNVPRSTPNPVQLKRIYL